jgi:hypothetical protein
MKLITMAVIVIGALTAVNNIQQAHAVDSNGNDKKKPCNDQHSNSPTKCSQKDITPFILPFP